MANHPQMNELADEHGMDLHYGREEKMPDHVHKYQDFDGDYADKPGYKCSCSDLLSRAEGLKRINATERLSAEDALGYVRIYEKGHAYFGSLRAYASVLEGEVAPR